MTYQDFAKLIEQFDKDCNATLQVANKEYANEDEKFNNFQVIATLLRLTSPRLRAIRPQDIALVFLMKHLISIVGEVSIREDMVGRYMDVANYIKLHYGMHIEGQSKKD